jgi:hypothetical protein
VTCELLVEDGCAVLVAGLGEVAMRVLGRAVERHERVQDDVGHAGSPFRKASVTGQTAFDDRSHRRHAPEAVVAARVDETSGPKGGTLAALGSGPLTPTAAGNQQA